MLEETHYIVLTCRSKAYFTSYEKSSKRQAENSNCIQNRFYCPSNKKQFINVQDSYRKVCIASKLL